jgi:DNA-binding transcriptional MocR family regulator
MIRSSDLAANERLVAIMIASHYDFTKKDPAFPSNKLLAKETGLSIRSIVRAKNVLTERHYLLSQRQYNNANLYIPVDPESQGYGTGGQLNTHINTHTNTNINTNINTVSNETVNSSLKQLKQGDKSFEELFNFFEIVNEPGVRR